MDLCTYFVYMLCLMHNRNCEYTLVYTLRKGYQYIQPSKYKNQLRFFLYRSHWGRKVKENKVLRSRLVFVLK